MKAVNKKYFLNGTINLMVVITVATVYHCKNPKLESDYFKPEVIATHSSGWQFVGSETCKECHADIYATHVQTAHFKTSATASSENIKGSFEKDSNILDLKDVKFTMLSEENSFYQHIKIKNRTIQKEPKKFDIIIGSGVRGQSYLSWEDEELFQLQTSYYTPTDSWVNSPGFPSYYLDRPIRDACIKCHVTFAKNSGTARQGNSYDRQKMIYGIDCERCHRPSANHVNYHRKNFGATTSKYMMKFDTLSRQQQLDACAQCHSGPKNILLKGNSFSFLAGDNLAEFTQNAPANNSKETLDVHGNQYGLLIDSKCFKETSTMSCNTCHDPHKNQRGDTSFFNQKCIGCHSAVSVKCAADELGLGAMGNNCISCHMPVLPSRAMAVQLGNDSLETSFNIRTHLIGIYPKISAK